MRAILCALLVLGVVGCGVEPIQRRLTCHKFERPIVVDGTTERAVSTYCLDDGGGWTLRALEHPG